jgi:hypothetical protein
MGIGPSQLSGGDTHGCSSSVDDIRFAETSAEQYTQIVRRVIEFVKPAMQRGDESSASSGAPALKKIDITIARLRLLLADVSARERSLEDQRRTFREQQNKLVTFSMYGDSSLDSVLAMLGDVQERLTHLDATAQSLAAVRKRAEFELESLQLTKGIEEAKVLLQELQARQAAPMDAADALSAEEIQAEIARLQALINEASERAAQNIERAARRV